MAMLGINVNGPEWEQLTGIKVQRERASVRGALHQADAGAQGGERRLRRADDRPVLGRRHGARRSAGAARPLHREIRREGGVRRHRAGLQGLDDLSRARPTALVVDGDVHLLYYRKDIFEDPANKEEFKAKYGYDLGPPQTWKAFGEVCQFITDKYAPDDLWRRPHQHRLHALLLLRALPHLRRKILRRGDDEGDGEQPGRQSRR